MVHGGDIQRGGIMVVDVSNPASPRRFNLAVQGTVMEIFLNGSTAYLSCRAAAFRRGSLRD